MEAILVGILSSLGTAGIVFYVVIKYYNNVKNCISDIVFFLLLHAVGSRLLLRKCLSKQMEQNLSIH